MRKEVFVATEYYHIYNRGVDKRDIFLDDRDRIRFIHSAHLVNNFLEIPRLFDVQKLSPPELLIAREPIVKIVAGCLMPNHFHLVLTPLQDGGVSKFLHKLGISYTMYFNKRNERSGRLFESTFKAKHVDRHEYASYLTQYIHFNPVELSQTKSGGKIEEYPWSSLPVYLDKECPFSLLVDSSFRDEVLGMDAEEYRKHLT